MTSLNPVVDAIRRADRIEFVHVRNEEAGAFAAAAESQLTGRLAVCAGSCGPGSVHLLQGLYDAHRTGAPVLAIASLVPSLQIGTSFFQENHPERLFVDCSHYCELVSQAGQMPRLARTAIQHALGLGGVSVLVMPGDVLHRRAEHPTDVARPVSSCAAAVPAAEQVQALAERLNAADTVSLFCGAGAQGAHAEVMQLAGWLHSPIGHSLRGKEWIQYENPYDTFLPGARTIQVDHNLSRLGISRTIIAIPITVTTISRVSCAAQGLVMAAAAARVAFIGYFPA